MIYLVISLNIEREDESYERVKGNLRELGFEIILRSFWRFLIGKFYYFKKVILVGVWRMDGKEILE